MDSLLESGFLEQNSFTQPLLTLLFLDSLITRLALQFILRRGSWSANVGQYLSYRSPSHSVRGRRKYLTSTEYLQRGLLVRGDLHGAAITTIVTSGEAA